MKRLAVSGAIAIAASLALLHPYAASAQQGTRTVIPDRYVQGRILVQPRPGLSVAELDRILAAYGGTRTGVIKQINVHIVELPPQANALAIAQALAKNRNLKFAEVDAVFYPEFYPNDPRYSVEWHLPKIGASTAWDQAQGNGVTIAILDSGVDTTHPDLAAQLVPGWNFYDNNSDVSDVAGHGTTVAGVAAAVTNNATGVASVSFGSHIMPMRVTDTSGNGFASLMAAALTAAADNGARVGNLSFLGVSYSSAVDSAAQYMRSKGGVVVTASGNTGALRTEPVLSSLTVVAATDSNDAKATFSSWGDYVDISAPGVSISTTTRGGGYGSSSGTSVSSPIVAGVYALMMSANPGLAPATLDNILFSTALDLGTAGWDQQFGNGRVQADKAVAMAMQTSAGDTQAPTVAISSPGSGATVSGLVPVDVSAGDNVGVARVELYANNALVATDTTGPFGFSLDATKYADGSLPLQARAYDAAGNAASSATVTVTVANDTTPPTVAITSPAAGSTVSGTVAVNVSASDNKQVAKISLTIDGSQVAISYGSSLSYSWKVPKAKGKGSATSTISAQALDAAGNGAVASITVKR
jgi:thermitase